MTGSTDEVEMPQPAPFDVDTAVLDGGVHVVSVKGELDLNTAPRLEEALEPALAGERPAVVLDLSSCEFIDSTGIALIVGFWQRADRNSEHGGTGRFALCNPNQQVRKVLEITGVDSSIALHEERDAAIADVSAD